MTPAAEHLFVYGTLMPGQCRWDALALWAGEPSPDVVNGQLFDTGYGWPAAVIGAQGTVLGFTVQVDPIVLEALDQIEGTMFARITIATANGVAAWVYHWPGPTEGFTPIARWPEVGKVQTL